MSREIEVSVGTDFNFVGTIDKNLLCPICSDPLSDPVETHCGHTYCLLCICEWIRRNATCCLDKAPLRPDDLRPVNKIITSQLNELPVQCVRCDGKFLWQQIKDHVRTQCALTPIPCGHPGCGRSLPRSAVEEHRLQCAHRVVSHTCGMPVSIMDMEEHCASECLDADVPCIHASFGCDWRGLRRDISAHCSTCRFEGVKDVLRAQQETIARLQSKECAVDAAASGASIAQRRRSVASEKAADAKAMDADDDKENIRNGVALSEPKEAKEAHASGPLVEPDAPADLVSGLYWDYYEGTFTWLPDFEQLTPTSRGQCDGISVGELFKKGVLNAPVNTDLYQTGDFAVRFRGFIEVPFDGEYTLYASSNDGSRVWIGGKLIVDNDGCHYKQEVEGSVRLARGRHSISVGYFHKNGKVLEGGLRTGIHLKVFYYYAGTNYWGRNRVNKQRIPNHSFYRPLLDDKIKSLKEFKAEDEEIPYDPAHVESERLKAAEKERDEARAASVVQTGRVVDLERQLQSVKAVAMSMEIALRHAQKDRHSALSETHKMQARTMDLEETLADLKERYFAAVALNIKVQMSGAAETERRRSTKAKPAPPARHFNVNISDMYDLAVARSLALEEWPRHIAACLMADSVMPPQTPGPRGPRASSAKTPGTAAHGDGGMMTRSRMCRIPGSPSSGARRGDLASSSSNAAFAASYVPPVQFALSTSAKTVQYQSAAF